eukprot:g6147.t1
MLENLDGALLDSTNTFNFDKNADREQLIKDLRSKLELKVYELSIVRAEVEQANTKMKRLSIECEALQQQHERDNGTFRRQIYDQMKIKAKLEALENQNERCIDDNRLIQLEEQWRLKEERYESRIAQLESALRLSATKRANREEEIKRWKILVENSVAEREKALKVQIEQEILRKKEIQSETEEKKVKETSLSDELEQARKHIIVLEKELKKKEKFDSDELLSKKKRIIVLEEELRKISVKRAAREKEIQAWKAQTESSVSSFVAEAERNKENLKSVIKNMRLAQRTDTGTENIIKESVWSKKKEDNKIALLQKELDYATAGLIELRRMTQKMILDRNDRTRTLSMTEQNSDNLDSFLWFVARMPFALVFFSIIRGFRRAIFRVQYSRTEDNIAIFLANLLCFFVLGFFFSSGMKGEITKVFELRHLS